MPLRPNMQPKEFLEVFLRRKWFVIFSILLILFGASVYCVVTPEMYKSSTTILVIPQRVPENYVKSTVSGRIEDRLASIQQQVQSRTRLVAVMDELGLFSEERKRTPLEVLLESMRKRITIQVQGGKTDSFTLSFLHENPVTAMRTTSRLASFFIDESLKSREQQAVGTASFLESQLRTTKKKLEAQEERVKRYKTIFMGELPQQLQANMQIMSRLQEQLKANADAIRIAQDRKMFIESQVRTLEHNIQVSTQAHSISGGTDSATADPGDPAAPYLLELKTKRAQLANLSTKYTEQYPEIRRLKEEVARLEHQVADARRHGDGNSPSPSGESAPRTAETEELRRLHTMLTGLDLEIQSLKVDSNEIRKKAADVESKVERSPKREQEMISLTRDYDNLKASYDDLLKKKLDADVAQNLEKRQKDDQFQILDPANLPEKPFVPNRPKVFGIAVFAALLLGFGGAVGLEILDPSARTVKDFRQFSDLTVLATIPKIQNMTYLRKKKMQSAAVYGGLAAFASIVIIFLLIYGNKIRMILGEVR
jgi:polysaccharide chain length determinant protein (PEP-CTERM system associated)